MKHVIAIILNFIVTHKASFSFTGVFIIFFLFVSYWRAKNRELRSMGFGDKETGRLLAFRFLRSIYLITYNRTLTCTNMRSHFTWLKDKFGTHFSEGIERDWPRIFFLNSYFVIRAEQFPEKIPYPKVKASSPWVLQLGVKNRKQKAAVQIDEISKLYIGGEPGSGKTELVRLICSQIPRKLIITPKPFDFFPEESIDSSYAENLPLILDNLKLFDQEIETRKKDLIASRKKHVKHLNCLPWAIVVDEAAMLLNTAMWDKQHKELIEKIVSQLKKIERTGRAYGIILIICTQKARRQDTMLNSVKDGIVLIGRVDTAEISIQLIGSDEACDPTIKAGEFFLRDQNGTHKIKAYLLEDL